MNSHSLLTGFAILLFIQFLGTWIIGTLNIPLPPALLGMILLAIAMPCRISFANTRVHSH